MLTQPFRTDIDENNAKLEDNEDLRTTFVDEEHPTYYLSIIRLNPGISSANFTCCLMYYMFMIFSFITPAQLQPLIILSPDYYNVSQNKAGTITSLVLIIQLIVKIAFSIPYGYLSDRLGRKIIIYYGATSFLIGCLLVPQLTTIFPGLIIAKVFTSNANVAMGTIPLIADYVADESKGRAVALSAMFIGLSALAGNLFIKALFYAELSLGTCYVITGFIVFVAMLLISFGLKGNDYYTERFTRNIEESRDEEPLWEKFKEVLEIFKANGWLQITLVLNMLGSSDFIVFLSFMALYVKSIIPSTVDDASANIIVNNLQTLVFIPLFFSNIAYGYFLDKKDRILGTALLALFGGAVSFILIAVSQDPHGWTIIVGALLLGTTIPGLFVISTSIAIKHYPADKRGIMIAFTGMIGYIGYFIIATGGGFLYDHWMKNGPFIVCTGLLGVAAVLVLVIYARLPSKDKP